MPVNIVFFVGHQIDIVFTGKLKHSNFLCSSQVPDISVLEKPDFNFDMDFLLFFFNCSLKSLRTRIGWILTVLQTKNCLN